MCFVLIKRVNNKAMLVSQLASYLIKQADNYSQAKLKGSDILEFRRAAGDCYQISSKMVAKI